MFCSVRPTVPYPITNKFTIMSPRHVGDLRNIRFLLEKSLK